MINQSSKFDILRIKNKCNLHCYCQKQSYHRRTPEKKGKNLSRELVLLDNKEKRKIQNGKVE